MSTVIDTVPPEHQEIFIEILRERDKRLLDALKRQGQPTLDQQELVAEIFGIAFMENLGPDHDHPTERAVRIDDALAAFLYRWPGEILEGA